MSHDEAVAQVRVELQQMIDSEHQPAIRPIAASTVFNGLRNAPALIQAARVTLARLNDIILLVRTGITLDQLLEKKPQSRHGGDAAVTKGTTSEQVSGAGGGNGLPDPEEPEKKGEIKYPDNPKAAKDSYKQNIPKTKARENKTDGSVWESDMSSHGGQQWKMWKSRRSWENGDKPASVWPDGRIRKWGDQR